MIVQFEEKKDCCGCAACMNICPTNAIHLKSDKSGFMFPIINHEWCIKCRKCIDVCAYQNVPVAKKEPLSTYVAINKNNDILSYSASGGIFGAVSAFIYEKKGVIFGCAYDENMEPKHIGIESKSDITMLQGSKYVQSSIETTFTEAKKNLDDGRWVFYTGTPCQIAGFKSYLGKDYEKLITADIVCHGVPSAEFFISYIRCLEGKLNGKVIDFRFRDKTKGWGKTGKVSYQKSGKTKEKLMTPRASSYYHYFLKGYTFRESCYECKYACGSREGDFTMGDYWGIESAHSEIETDKGVSVLLVNSEKGILLLEELMKYLNLTPSTFELAKAENIQLNRPTSKSNMRESILRTWRDGGYEDVEGEFYRVNKRDIRLTKLKMMVPEPIKRNIKRVIGRK